MMEISLALGGGGIRGIAHIGAIRKLENEGFVIKAIAGTSIGGLIGSVYAAGYSTDDIEKIILDFDQTKMLSHGLIDSPSLFGLHGISQALTHILHNKTFDELRIPFACTAVDIRSAQEFIMADSCVLDAVLATIAIPGIFPPVEIGNRLLVDGGILDPVPVALARWLSPKIPVVAICLTPAPESWVVLPPIRPSPGSIIPKQILEQFGRLKIGQAFNIFAQSIDITSRTLAELRLQIDHPDMIIRPDVDQYGLLDRVDPKDLIIRGEEAVEKRLKELHQTFSIKNKIFRQFQPSTQPGKLLQRRNNLVQKNKIQENDA